MKITMNLSDKSIDDALKKVKEYQKYIDQKTKLLTERLALIGAQEASVRFTTAIYDGVNDVTVNVHRVKDGWAIAAKGKAVCFIEFGSGVHHNSAEPYPNPRPSGVVGIGEYGDGKGKRDTWVYYDESKNKVFTHGNPASMPLWYATEEMRRAVESVAREVFHA